MVSDRDVEHWPNGCTSIRVGSDRESIVRVQHLDTTDGDDLGVDERLTNALILQQTVHVVLHQVLNEIDVLHLIERRRTDDILQIDDVLVFETCENLDFSQRPLTEALMFEWRELLYCHALARLHVVA